MMSEGDADTAEGTPGRDRLRPALHATSGLQPSMPKLALSPRQSTLLSALATESTTLSTIYLGALMVFGDDGNPDRIPLSAHGMRELMAALPAHVDVPIKAGKGALTIKVNELSDAWKRLRDRSRNLVSEGWTGSVDDHLRKFLGFLARFLAWHEEHRPRRRVEVQRVLERLDAAERKLPQALARLNVDAWQEMNDYFNSVAHHGHVASDEEHRQWTEALEAFLVDRFAPRTFEEFAQIDGLIDGVEK